MEHVDVAVIGGGQSGPAAAYALARRGRAPVILEASDRAAGSWSRYYDSLTLFPPARFSALPGTALGGDPDRYPHRDEGSWWSGPATRRSRSRPSSLA
ncbi:FAD-dependent oxidoreductase [Streptomyces sp. MB09-01]|uniref:FAD-dependent oxidoreductase n=1 Tax=Streptomyces sp. MB09-01 TaxID=3028666 RepID=UPI0029BF6ED5|nr:FAD-dependent oxidoreductase [Streptomyces sp. MB09-01]MDX3534681.1 FAD-dependent oxidoreductase [Streptomyces sp. MB09-01]